MDNIAKKWVANFLKTEDFTLCPLAGDASHRQYARVISKAGSFMLMQAPVKQEPVDAFVDIAYAWAQQKIQVPHIFSVDKARGLVLLSDFGDCLLQDKLSSGNVQHYYRQALNQVAQLQALPIDYPYPLFDRAHIQIELNYFREWFLNKWLGITLSDSDIHLLDTVFLDLIEACEHQPQTIIHRDYHSRNLMVLADDTLGIIDFQDAMMGPIVYDLVSLLRDCYVMWPIERVYLWLEEFFHQSKLLRTRVCSFEQIKRGFDKVGLQRHLKVLGIFSRLSLRDGKTRYLHDIPRILHYVYHVLPQYPELQAFQSWFSLHILPKLQEKLVQEGVPIDTTFVVQQVRSA